MTTSTTTIAKTLLENNVPLLRCCTGLKTPHKNEGGTWDTITDPDMLGTWLKPGDNLAMLLGESKGSPVLGVGLDVYKDAKIIDFAKSLGVTTKENTWGQRTGRGGYTVIYFYNGPALKRDTRQEGSAIDLLVNGYTLIAPSDTSREPQGGGAYTWIKGKSPLDIPLAELDTPPKDLLLWWQSLAAPKLPDARSDWEPGGKRPSPDWLTGLIPDGFRDTTMTQRIGYWHRMIPDDEAVRALAHSVNRADCQPPLPDRDIEKILNSILPRQGAAHFRGVRPATLEAIGNG
jgi:hypothetical protein